MATLVPHEWRHPIESRADVEQARREARRIARLCGFGGRDAESLVLAVSELAANLVEHAHGGRFSILSIETSQRPGVEIESLDDGPGIPDLELAMRDGYSTAGGLGSGLAVAERMMDEFHISSSLDGTRIVARKWKSTT